MKRLEDTSTKHAHGAILDPKAEIFVSHPASGLMKKQERLIRFGDAYIKYALARIILPNQRRFSLNKRCDCGSRVISRNAMKNAYKLSEHPARHAVHSGRIHQIRIDVATYVTNTSIVPHLIECDKHSRDKDAHASIADTR